MVFVTVGDNQAPDPIHVLFKPGEVGDHDVHAQHIRIREAHAAVYDENIVAALISGDVLTDLV